MGREEILEFLARHFRDEGHAVLGLHPGEPAVPEGWEGPAPDLYAEKGRQRLAVVVPP